MGGVGRTSLVAVGVLLAGCGDLVARDDTVSSSLRTEPVPFTVTVTSDIPQATAPATWDSRLILDLEVSSRVGDGVVDVEVVGPSGAATDRLALDVFADGGWTYRRVVVDGVLSTCVPGARCVREHLVTFDSRTLVAAARVTAEARARLKDDLDQRADITLGVEVTKD